MWLYFWCVELLPTAVRVLLTTYGHDMLYKRPRLSERDLTAYTMLSIRLICL